MQQVTMVPFVGATAVGKNFLMSATGYHVVGTTLTRQPRLDDDPAKYTYVSNEYLLEQIAAAEVVQYAVSPTAPTIYSSMVSDYAFDQPNAMDCFFDAVAGLRTKGYKAVKTISVFTPATQWRTQLDDRYAQDTPEYVRSRLDEAVASIRWSLEQAEAQNPDHHLVINDPQHFESVIHSIHAFVKGESFEYTPIDVARQAADNMLEVIDDYRRGLGIQ